MHPFPTSPDKRREAAAAMKAAAPDLMDEIAALRAQFAGARMTYFKADGLEFGRTPMAGWVVDVPLPKAEIDVATEARSKAADRKRHDTIKRKLKQ